MSTIRDHARGLPWHRCPGCDRPIPPEVEGRMTERAGTLLRDFLMAPYLSGALGAGRKAKRGLKNVLAFLLAQLVALVVFCAIVAAILLVLRVRGESLDGWLDRLIALLP